MKKIIRILFVLFPFIAIGQTQTENYIKTVTYKVASSVKITAPTILQASQNTVYFDGLGRPVQEIAGQQSATGKDVIKHIKYDGFGRQVEEYLPFKSSNTNMAFDPLAEANVLSYYANPNVAVNGNPSQEATAYPFNKKELEASPLGRVMKQAAPGNDWRLGSGHEIKIDYQTNTANDVRILKVGITWDAAANLYGISFINNGYYAEGQLSKTITYDENTAALPAEQNGSTVEFKNKSGQVVLKRTYGSVGTATANERHDTYYVYDVYGNLTYVLPPKASDLIGTTSATATQADITSTVTVTSNAPLNLTATNSITLLPGFKAIEGSVFSAVIDMNQTILDNLAYQYKYDYRNRLVEKKIPGKQWEFIVYDKLDRVVATGPAYSPFSDITASGWLITKYDVFSRPVYTGWMNSTAATSAGRAALQAAQSSSSLTVFNETKQSTGTIDGIAAYYSNVVAPTAFKLLSVNYYDNYVFPSSPAIPIPASVEGQAVMTSSQVKGMQTASWTRVLTTSASIAGETSATFYDLNTRQVRMYTQNYLKGYTYTDNQLDFSGKILSSTIRHKRTEFDAELVTKDIFNYSDQDRLVSQSHQINGAQPVEDLSSNVYDELGQLISKKVGGNIQNIHYTYNIRGWLTGINDTGSLVIIGDSKDLFAFKINYNNPATVGINPIYNGNISEAYWTSASEMNPLVRGYGYTYDVLNRLKTSVFKRDGIVNSAYDENLTYDKNGNITSIKRNGSNETTVKQIDNLLYSYKEDSKTNQLAKVIDSAPVGEKTKGFIDSGSNTTDDYEYDSQGNLIKDNNKNISKIVYNHLNLPIEILFTSNENIVYVYNAEGQKIKKIVNRTGVPVTVTDYLDGFQYFNNVLRFFPIAEGYVEHNAGGYKYIYQYKDHLGNVRLSYDRSLNIQEENNYYPFGLKHFGYNNNSVSTNDALKYKYNGKELQDENIGGQELTLYDYGARNYDPALGRWFNMDPLTEKFEDWSPYNYVFNNPLKLMDPTGMSPEDSTDVIKNSDGTYTVVGGNVNDGDNSIYQLNTDGSRTRVGYSATPYSFYNTDLNAFMGTIDPKNNIGREFLNTLLKDSPNEIYYGYNATGGQKYDFKRTNGTSEAIYSDKNVEDYFRGMPILGKEKGLPIFASARDIGNVGAGLVVGRNGSSWGFARLGFDALESTQKKELAKETAGTVYAERLGWNIGNAIYQKTELSRIPGNAHLYNTVIPKSYIGSNFKQKR